MSALLPLPQRRRPPTPPAPAAPPLARWWRSRYGAELVQEVAVVVALLFFYKLGRTLGRDEAHRALAHAHQVLRVEGWFGIDDERALQQLALHDLPLVRLLNRYYATVHFPLSIAFLVFVYVRAPRLVAHVRYLFVTVTAAALVLHLAYPLAPPRMLPGFVDTVARYGPTIYDKPGVASIANQYAAMPSLHFGWSFLVAYGVVRALHTPWRWLVVLHPALTLVAIVVSANHYWLDAIVALALIALALAVAPAGARPAPAPRPEPRPTELVGPPGY
jgi:PAP2 superfamily